VNSARFLGVDDIPGTKQAPFKAFDLSFRCDDQKIVISVVIKDDKVFSGGFVLHEFHSE